MLLTIARNEPSLLASYDISIPIPRKIVFQCRLPPMIRLKLPSSILSTMAPLDPPDPSTNKSSLLWAYHLRQENIHLVGRIDIIGAELVSANEKTLSVQQSFSALETRLKALEAEKQAENEELRHEMRSLMGKFSEAIEDATLQIKTVRDEMMGLRASVESVTLRVKAIEEDAAELRAGLRNVENKCALVQKHVEASLSEVAREMHNLQRDTGGGLSQPAAMNGNPHDRSLRRSSRINAARFSRNGNCKNLEIDVPGHQDNRDESITTIPNSMPSHDSAFQSLQLPSTQPVTGLENEDTETESPLSSVPLSLAETQTIDPEDDFKCLKQDKKSLAEYLSMAERMRSQLPRRKQEGVIVEAFYEGLGDRRVKVCLERYLHAAGWTWKSLEGFCRHWFAREKNNVTEMLDAGTGVVQWPEYGKGKTKRQRAVEE